MPSSQSEVSLSELIRSLSHVSAPNRVRSARAIARLGVDARQALNPLLSAVEDSEQVVREAVVQALASLGEVSLPHLTRLASHPDKYIRRTAIWGLGKLGPIAESSISKLCMALRDEDSRSATAAAQALANLGHRASSAVPALIEAMRGTNIVLCRMASKALSQIGSAALPQLISHLSHPDLFVRGEAAVALGWMGETAISALPNLIQVLRQQLPQVRRSNRIAQLDSGVQTPMAIQLLEPGCIEETIILNVIQAIGRFGEAAYVALPLLAEARELPSDLLRQAADLAIRTIQNPDATR